jgi:hypothetical protein
MNNVELKEVRRSGLYLISITLIYCLAVMSFLPVVKSLPFFNYIWPIFVAAWLATAIMMDNDFFLKPDLHQVLTYIFFFYTILIAFVAGNGFIGNRFLEYLQLPIFYWAYRINERKGWHRDSVKLLLGLVPVVIFTSIVTLSQYITNPNISRTAKKDTTAGLEQMSQGVAGYEFIYFLVFLFGPLLYLLISKRKQYGFVVKLFLILLLSMIMINIALSNFMIAALLVLLSIIFKLFIPKMTTNRAVLYLFISLVILPVAPYFVVAMIDLILSFSDGSMNAERLLEIQRFLSLGIIDLSMNARLYAFQSSLEAFFNNPLVGIITTDIGGSGDGLIGFGQHSFLLDTFALYGGVVGLLSIYIYLQPLYQQVKFENSESSSLPFLMFLIVFLFFTINNVTPSIGFAIYFAFPVLYGLMRTENLN